MNSKSDQTFYEHDTWFWFGALEPCYGNDDFLKWVQFEDDATLDALLDNFYSDFDTDRTGFSIAVEADTDCNPVMIYFNRNAFLHWIFNWSELLFSC